jgi:hypothetical protein
MRRGATTSRSRGELTRVYLRTNVFFIDSGSPL